MAFSSRFNFVGTPVLPKPESKRPFYREFKGGKTKTANMASMTFGIKESDNNLAFVEAFGGEQAEIFTMDTENNKISVAWSDRFNDDVMSCVANYKKYIVDLGESCGGRKTYISQYDAVLHLYKWLPKYDGMVVVTGQFVKEWYKTQYYDKFKVQNVFAAPADSKPRLSLLIDIYYNKDSLDMNDFKEEKKIYLNGYISQYINGEEGSKYIPQQFVFSAAKYDMENDHHKKLYEYKLKYLSVKNKTMVHIPWDIVLIRGAESVEFNESMLTEAQREQVELGIRSVEDFRPRGDIYGNKINEYRLFDPKLTGDFTDGLIDTGIKATDFKNEVYEPPVEERIENINIVADDEDDEDPPFETDSGIDDEDLF